MEKSIQQLNGLALAYIGDAAYELYIRSHLIKRGMVKANHLHTEAVKYVSGKAQAGIIHYLLEKNHLTDQEKRIVRRGRNAKSASIPKNISVQDYRYSTGFEALIGYLHLTKDSNRLKEIFQKSVRFIEGNGSDE